MSKACEQITKRRVVLADGRYLIFFTCAPAEVPSPTQPADGETEPKQENPGEER